MRYVLFVCNHNAGRSQMAQAFFERYAPEDVRAESAGSTPARAVADGRRGDVRDAIETRVRELIETELDSIRSDPTAHRFRLTHLLPTLAEEFEGSRSPEETRACADAVLSRFDDQPVRSYVQILAHRQTRECLRKDACDVLAGA